MSDSGQDLINCDYIIILYNCNRIEATVNTLERARKRANLFFLFGDSWRSEFDDQLVLESSKHDRETEEVSSDGIAASKFMNADARLI